MALIKGSFLFLLLLLLTCTSAMACDGITIGFSEGATIPFLWIIGGLTPGLILNAALMLVPALAVCFLLRRLNILQSRSVLFLVFITVWALFTVTKNFWSLYSDAMVKRGGCDPEGHAKRDALVCWMNSKVPVSSRRFSIYNDGVACLSSDGGRACRDDSDCEGQCIKADPSGTAVVEQAGRCEGLVDPDSWREEAPKMLSKVEHKYWDVAVKYVELTQNYTPENAQDRFMEARGMLRDDVAEDFDDALKTKLETVKREQLSHKFVLNPAFSFYSRWKDDRDIHVNLTGDILTAAPGKKWSNPVRTTFEVHVTNPARARVLRITNLPGM